MNIEPNNVMIDSQTRKVMKENRAKLRPIVEIEIVIFLGRNVLPFRGHMDD